MTKQNYHKKQQAEYEKKIPVRVEPTNCFKCDGYDQTCSRYVGQSDLYITNCMIKRNLQPESELEKRVHHGSR